MSRARAKHEPSVSQADVIAQQEKRRLCRKLKLLFFSSSIFSNVIYITTCAEVNVYEESSRLA